MALPQGTVTFLFTDVEGSTRRLEEAPESYARELEASRRAIRAACRRGAEVDTQGDSFFFAFARAEDAVTAAAEAQERLAPLPIRVRMGLHTGEPRPAGEGYVGVDVNRAARIAAAAHGGQVLLSQTTHDLVPGADVVDLGEHRLKDLSLPAHLYQLGRTRFPPPLTLENRPTNLPAQPWPLLGRERELADLRALVERPSPAIVTVTGAAGAGKTRLALQVAADAVDLFPDGVWYVALEAVRDPSLVTATVAATLAVPEQELDRHLAARRVLLLLDNLEQLLEAAPAVAALSASGAVVLATSRAPLRVSGEQEYPLAPLAVGPGVELFLARAHAVRPGFTVRDGTAAELVRRLDGLPLAIELAAARVRLLSPEAILERLCDRRALLAGGARDRPPRQQTLWNAIEWSYRLLSTAERALFARVSCFCCDFDLAAAEAVCGATVDGLEALVENSLVRVDDAGRFSLLDSLRQFAHERLAESGELDEIARRHAAHYLRLVGKPPDGEAFEAWIELVGREADNVRAARATLHRRSEVDAEARVTLALATYLLSRSVVIEADAMLDELGPRLGDVDDELVGHLDQVHAHVHWLRGDAAGSRVLAREVLRRGRELGNAELEAWGLNGMALCALREEDYGTADDWFAQYEELARRRLPRRLPLVVNNRAVIELIRGRPVRAREALLPYAGAEIAHGTIEHNIALTHIMAGERAAALEWIRRASAMALRSGRDGILVYDLHALAAALADDRPSLAARVRGSALALARRLGVVMEEPDAGLAQRTDEQLSLRLGEGYAELLANGSKLAPAEALELASSA